MSGRLHWKKERKIGYRSEVILGENWVHFFHVTTFRVLCFVCSDHSNRETTSWRLINPPPSSRRGRHLLHSRCTEETSNMRHLFILWRELVKGIQHHLCVSLGLRISLLKIWLTKIKRITNHSFGWAPSHAQQSCFSQCMWSSIKGTHGGPVILPTILATLQYVAVLQMSNMWKYQHGQSPQS